MSSLLIITSVENLQEEVNAAIKVLEGKTGIYLSLNKSCESVEKNLKSNKINVDKIFFIDGVASEKSRDDFLHISPTQLDLLTTAIKTFIKKIPSEKYLIIDTLATLLIYNSPNKVAQFVKNITEIASQNEIRLIAFSPKTKGEELLDKIFNFFDKVKK
mgnify:CR=1 FL=1